MLKIYKAYIDTNVIGGCFDKEFSILSNKLIDSFYKNKISLYISNLTEVEILNAPIKIKKFFFEILNNGIQVLNENNESLSLANLYISEKILSKNYLDDARHIAIATVSDLDLILSWNFKHIVNYNRIKQFNSINIREGYKEIDIFSPREVINE